MSLKKRNSYKGLDEYASTFSRVKARQLARLAGYSNADRDDIEQELLLEYILKIRQYDPSKGKKSTFVSSILERRISTLMEHRFAQRRDCRVEIALTAEPFSEDYDNSKNLHDGIDLDRWLINACQESNMNSINELRIDIQKVLATLPTTLRDLCERLHGSTLQEISRDTGVSRHALYARMKKIREAFYLAGMDEWQNDIGYLKSFPHID